MGSSGTEVEPSLSWARRAVTSSLSGSESSELAWLPSPLSTHATRSA